MAGQHAGMARVSHGRPVVLVIVVGGVLSAVAAAGLSGISIAVGAVALAILIWQLGKCRHMQPLGLLPPILDDQGARVPARWYCDDCGASWPAMFERGRPPVSRFSGYDQSKAPAAAKRAKTLRDGQRVLAIERAGLNTRVAHTPVRKSDRRLPAPTLNSGGPVSPIKGPVAVPSRRIAG